MNFDLRVALYHFRSIKTRVMYIEQHSLQKARPAIEIDACS